MTSGSPNKAYDLILKKSQNLILFSSYQVPLLAYTVHFITVFPIYQLYPAGPLEVTDSGVRCI